MADLDVLEGCVAIEKAAFDARYPNEIPITPGRNVPTLEMTCMESFYWLRQVSHAFKNGRNEEVGYGVTPESLFLDRAQLLNLSALK